MRRNRPRPRAILSSPVTLLIVLLVLFFLFRSGMNIHRKSALSQEKLADARANLVKLEANKLKLEREIEDISTESGIEAEIREKYHAVAPGESVAVIVTDDEAGSVNTVTATTTVVNTSWWRGVLKFLGL